MIRKKTCQPEKETSEENREFGKVAGEKTPQPGEKIREKNWERRWVPSTL